MRICKDGRIWGQNNSYHNPEYIRKQREANSGPKHHNWKGGKSLLRKIRKRDEHRCQLCFKHQNELRNQNNKSYKLIVHHINLNKNNNNSDNLISLRRECHLKIYYNNQININNFPFKNKLTEVFLR